MKKPNIYIFILSAMFLGLGLVLPFLTGQIKQIGSMLLPMHIPVLLCGFICGKYYGLAIGFVTPLIRSLIFGMPYMYPNAVAMAFELATYGFAAGVIYSLFCRKNTVSVFISLVSAMLCGRIVWGIVQCFLLGVGNGGFTFGMFAAGAFFNAIPGIIIQLILIPIIMAALSRAGFLSEKK